METGEPRLDLDFLYGTAWKEDLTESCVAAALSIGYRAIDTANQRKHYFEQGVGKALTREYAESGLKRQELFLQTKFTYARGQDERKPYDENAPYAVQVRQSFESSLRHLNTDYIDSYVLHGPSAGDGLTDADRETWGAMEEIFHRGQARHLGISNFSLKQLIELYERASVKPAFVQNRCFAEKHWDKAIREFCSGKGIQYQGFSLLTANRDFLAGSVLRPEGRNIPHLVFNEGPRTDAGSEGLHPEVARIAEQTGRNIQQIVFRFARQIDILPVMGSRSPEHMKANLEIRDFTLTDPQLQILENIAFLD